MLTYSIATGSLCQPATCLVPWQTLMLESSRAVIGCNERPLRDHSGVQKSPVLWLLRQPSLPKGPSPHGTMRACRSNKLVGPTEELPLMDQRRTACSLPTLQK